MFKRLIGVAFCLGLSACGGGTSEESPASPVTAYPVDAVLTGLLTHEQSLIGWYTNPSGAVSERTVSYVPGSAGVVVRTEVIMANGSVQSSRTDTISYSRQVDGLMVVAWTNNLGTFSTFDLGSRTVVPVSAAVGSGGSLASVTVTTDAMGAVFDTRTLDWTLSAVSDHTALLCLNFGFRLVWGGGTDSDCFVINANGDSLRYTGVIKSSVAHVTVNETYQ